MHCIYIAEEPNFSRAEEEALFNELMSQLAESQGEDEGEGVAQDDDDDEGGLEDYILQRYLQNVARTQGFGKGRKAFNKGTGFLKKVLKSPITHQLAKLALYGPGAMALAYHAIGKK